MIFRISLTFDYNNSVMIFILWEYSYDYIFVRKYCKFILNKNI